MLLFPTFLVPILLVPTSLDPILLVPILLVPIRLIAILLVPLFLVAILLVWLPALQNISFYVCSVSIVPLRRCVLANVCFLRFGPGKKSQHVVIALKVMPQPTIQRVDGCTIFNLRGPPVSVRADIFGEVVPFHFRVVLPHKLALIVHVAQPYPYFIRDVIMLERLGGQEVIEVRRFR